MKELAPLGSSLSLNIVEVLKGHPGIFTFMNLEMAGRTKGNLLTIDG